MAGHRTNGTPKKRSSPDWAPRFLARLRECGNITAACSAAAVARNTVYHRRDTNEAFAALMSLALEEAIDGLELEAYRRATRKNDPSDTLLIFLLKANRPEKYRDRYDVRHTGGLVLEVVEEILDAPNHSQDDPSAQGTA